jgi:Tfp pilus assembly protein PilN
MKTNINLLPPVLRRKQMARQRVVQWSAVVGITLLVIWTAGWIKLREYHLLSQKLEVLTREHRPNHAMLKELVAMRNTLAGLHRLETVAAELDAQRHVLTLLGLVSRSAQQTGGNLRVTSLKLMGFQGSGMASPAGAEPGSLILSGQSLDNPSVAELMDRLQESGLFTNVKLVSLKERQLSGVPFQDYEVRCEL